MENVIISCLSYLSKEWIEVNAGKRWKDHKYVRLTLNAWELEGLKIYHTLFYSLWKETHKPLTFKRGSFKKAFLQCVCYWYNLLQWIFFFPCHLWKALFFMEVYHYSEVFLTAMLLLSLKPAFWKKSVFYSLSRQ